MYSWLLTCTLSQGVVYSLTHLRTCATPLEWQRHFVLHFCGQLCILKVYLSLSPTLLLWWLCVCVKHFSVVISVHGAMHMLCNGWVKFVLQSQPLLLLSWDCVMYNWQPHSASGRVLLHHIHMIAKCHKALFVYSWGCSRSSIGFPWLLSCQIPGLALEAF